MTVEKNGVTYTVKETATMWTLAASRGNVDISFHVKKKDCPTIEELREFIANSD